MNWWLLLGVTLIVPLGGCVKAEYTELRPSAPAVTASTVEVFTSPPGRAHEEIGLVNVEAPPAMAMEQVIEHAKQEAAKRGAQAIILRDFGTGNSGAVMIANTSGPTPAYSAVPVRRKHLTAVAIRWK